MAMQVNYIFRGLLVEDAYLRVVHVAQDKRSMKGQILLGVWRNAAAAVLLQDSRTKLDALIAELATFKETQQELPNYAQIVQVAERNILLAQQKWESSIRPTEDALETRTFYTEHVVETGDIYAWAYQQLKAIPEFAAAIDV